MSMPFVIPYDVSGVTTLYIILTRDIDGFYVVDAAGTCQAGAPATWPSLTEDAVKKGQYALTVAALNDGKYSGIVYKKLGISQDPSVDEIVALISDRVVGNAFVVLPTAVEVRQETDANSTQLADIIAALGAGGGLSGIHSVTIQFYITATTTPIADVLCDVYNSTETLKLNGEAIKSNSLGSATFLRDTGTYKIRAMKAGVTFATGTIVVGITDVSAIIYGSPIVIDVPVPLGAIRVYELCFMPDGVTPMPTVLAKVRVKNLPSDYNGRLHSGQEIDFTYSAITGIGYWDLAPDINVEFDMPTLFERPISKIIPSTAPGDTIRLSEIP